MVSSAYLRLLIFLLVILIIPACDSSSLAFHIMYSVYTLNKQGDNIQLCRTCFLILNQSIVPCPVLTYASWPAYRFLRRQVGWSGTPISLRIFHSLLWATQRLVFSWWSRSKCFSGTPFLSPWSSRMLAIWSLVPLPFLNPACTSGSSQFTSCWSLAWRILSITLLACEMSAVVR